MRKEARTRFLEKKADQLLDEKEVEQLWEHMLMKKSKPWVAGQERVRTWQAITDGHTARLYQATELCCCDVRWGGGFS